MDRRERTEDLDTALLAALRGWQSGLWTALPAVVQSFDPDKCTVDVQPTIQALLTSKEGVTSWVTLPLFGQCPVVFPGGGGFCLTFPIATGDEVLVVFASRCIDAWWQYGGIQPQAELRMHDLSDGFVIPGLRSLPRVPGSISTANVVLRNDVGDTSISITPAKLVKVITPADVEITAANVTVTASADVTITATNLSVVAAVDITGSVTVTGSVATTGTLLNNGVNVGSTHVHQFIDNDDGSSLDTTFVPS